MLGFKTRQNFQVPKPKKNLESELLITHNGAGDAALKNEGRKVE